LDKSLVSKKPFSHNTVYFSHSTYPTTLQHHAVVVWWLSTRKGKPRLLHETSFSSCSLASFRFSSLSLSCSLRFLVFFIHSCCSHAHSHGKFGGKAVMFRDYSCDARKSFSSERSEVSLLTSLIFTSKTLESQCLLRGFSDS